MEIDETDPLTIELRQAQQGVDTIPALRKRRQDAVMAAWRGGDGWTKYKIAAVLGVAAPTVDSIIKAGGRAAE